MACFVIVLCACTTNQTVQICSWQFLPCRRFVPVQFSEGFFVAVQNLDSLSHILPPPLVFLFFFCNRWVGLCSLFYWFLAHKCSLQLLCTFVYETVNKLCHAHFWWVFKTWDIDFGNLWHQCLPRVVMSVRASLCTHNQEYSMLVNTVGRVAYIRGNTLVC